jgi:hypothetical protein
VFNQVNNVGAKGFIDDDILGIDDKLKSRNCIDDLQKDIEAGEKDMYDNIVRIEKTKTSMERLFTTHTSKLSLSIYRIM